MIRRLAVLLLLLAACNGAQQNEPLAPPAEAPPPDLPGEQLAGAKLDLDVDNLLNLAYGAGVVSRTAENHLESSAVHAIDGMTNTLWSSPPGDANATMVFSFAAPARVEQLGITTVSRASEVPAKIRFEASGDLRTWREVLVLEPREQGTPQLASVEPFEAIFLRVTTIEPHEQSANINSIHAVGQELAPPVPKRFGGCWTINGRTARFEQHGAYIRGVIDGDEPTYVDGGTDGRVARLMWMKGPMWGYVAATIAADDRSISGLIFHKNPLTGFAGAAWLGERCGDAAAPEPVAPRLLLDRAGHYSLSGLLFDDREQLVETMSRHALDALVNTLAAAPSQRFRIEAHEFRGANAEENRRRTEARVASIRAALQTRGADLSRIEFAASGSDWKIAETPFAVQRLLWSRTDLVVGR